MSNLTEGVLTATIKSGINMIDWEIGCYKTNSPSDIFDVAMITNWQNQLIFRGLKDGYYFVCIRNKENQRLIDYRLMGISCGVVSQCSIEMLQPYIPPIECTVEILQPYIPPSPTVEVDRITIITGLIQ